MNGHALPKTAHPARPSRNQTSFSAAAVLPGQWSSVTDNMEGLNRENKDE